MSNQTPLPPPARPPTPTGRLRRPQRLYAAQAVAAAAVPLHPLLRRHYRVATSAIEELVDLVEHCIRLLIPGALIHARPRMGKTHAIDYAALHLNRKRPDLLVLRMSCEHHRTQFEGSFFSALLSAAGVRDTQPGSISQKRFALARRLSEQLQVRNGHIVVLFCDEAQRLSKHALEWLRDVHDQLAQEGVRLITFLVGQPQLMEHKAQYQLAGDEQMERSAAFVWNAFVQAHAAAQLPGAIEIQMDYFTRAVEAVLTGASDWDGIGLDLGPAQWERAVRESGYVAAQQTVRKTG